MGMTLEHTAMTLQRLSVTIKKGNTSENTS